MIDDNNDEAKKELKKDLKKAGKILFCVWFFIFGVPILIFYLAQLWNDNFSGESIKKAIGAVIFFVIFITYFKRKGSEMIDDHNDEAKKEPKKELKKDLKKAGKILLCVWFFIFGVPILIFYLAQLWNDNFSGESIKKAIVAVIFFVIFITYFKRKGSEMIDDNNDEAKKEPKKELKKDLKKAGKILLCVWFFIFGVPILTVYLESLCDDKLIIKLLDGAMRGVMGFGILLLMKAFEKEGK